MSTPTMADDAPETAPAPAILEAVEEVSPTDAVLTVDEAAAYLKLSDQTVRTLQRNGEIESFRVGKSIRFRLVKIDEWIERQEQIERERIAAVAAS